MNILQLLLPKDGTIDSSLFKLSWKNPCCVKALFSKSYSLDYDHLVSIISKGSIVN